MQREGVLVALVGPFPPLGAFRREVPELLGALLQEVAQACLEQLGAREAGEAREVADEPAKRPHLLFDDLEGRV